MAMGPRRRSPAAAPPTSARGRSVLVHSTQDAALPQFTCANLEQGRKYSFGLVVESADRAHHSALSALLEVETYPTVSWSPRCVSHRDFSRCCCFLCTATTYHFSLC